MHIPGRDCLLHGMRLRFVSPVVLPARLRVHGKLIAESTDAGTATVLITDADSGRCYVDAAYDFGYHALGEQGLTQAATAPGRTAPNSSVLVTGASGGLGSALVQVLGDRAVPVSRSGQAGALAAPAVDSIPGLLGDAKLDAIVHCAWPRPDNMRLTRLSDIRAAIEFNIASPLHDMIALARLLQSHGAPNAVLVLVGSSFAVPGRHNYRMPLYTLAKGLIPALARILALELAPLGQRCVAVVYDVLDTGMNRAMSDAARLAQADRTLTGSLPGAPEAAQQIAWVLANHSSLLSGSTISLTGGAIP
jgi:NAD(P)-dependent dehydrogenase (short-subunit alcohol dehydrogenase family)